MSKKLYNQENIIQFIDLAFKEYTTNESLQCELSNIGQADLEQLQDLLKKADTLQALLILFNGLLCGGFGTVTDAAPLLMAADQYPLTCLALSNRAVNALSHLPDLKTVGDLLRMSDAEIARIRGVGPRSRTMEEIRAARMKFIRDFQNGLIR